MIFPGEICFLAAYFYSSKLMYITDRCAGTILLTATLKKILQISFAFSHSQIKLKQGQLVPVPTL